MNKKNPIERKRTAFRDQYGSVLFHSHLNTFLVILVFAFSLIYSGLQISWSLKTLPLLILAFVYADAILYFTHRFQQHRRIKFNERVFEMHAIWHHGMFSNKNMQIDSLKDMNMVVLPFFIHGFVLGLVYLPLAFLAERYFNSDIGWIFMFSIALHLCWYELVHTLAHLDNPPILKGLAAHHREHHNPSLMGKYNFGIATTAFDHLFRTRYSDN